MLNVYHGTDLERLADYLLKILGTQSLQNPLAPEVFVVQNHGIAQWLSLRMTRKEHIAANLKFEFPSERIWSLIRLIHPEIPQLLPSDRGPLTWSIMQLLQDEETISSFEKLRYYVQDDDTEQQTVRTWKLSTKIADVFDQYLVYRPDVILDWERNKKRLHKGAEHWQAILWNKLLQQWEKKHHKEWIHRARLQQELLETIDNGKLNTNQLPERVTVFGVSHMPTVFMQILVKLSKLTDIRIFHLSSHDSTTKDTFYENPLLEAMGKQGTDFQNQLTACIHKDAEVTRSFHVDSIDSLNLSEATVFNEIKGDVQQDRKPDPKKWATDPSLQVHSCHSPMREAEVLYDQLLAVLEQNPDMSPDDILIMIPDIDTYVPVISAVFREPDEGQPEIPFSIPDQHHESGQVVINTFLNILDLIKSRFKVTDVVDLLHANPVRERFKFSDDDLGRLERWIADNRIRWGINGVFKQQMDLPATENCTWKSGLDRMVLGYMMKPDDDHLYEDVYPFNEIETSDDAVLAGTFSHCLNALFSISQSCKQNATPAEWSRKLSKIIDLFLPDNRDYFGQVSLIRSALAQLQKEASLADYNQEIPFQIISSQLKNKLDMQASGGGHIGRGVTFSSLVAMRSIPFKMIGMIGMNEGAFPRSKIPIEFDLMHLEPRAGDPVPSEEDRHLFLENLWSAQTHIYFSYLGQSNQEDTQFPPSVILKTLLDYLDENYGLQYEDLVTEHPLQAFNPAYFSDETLFSYSQTQKKISARLLNGNNDIKPFFESELPEPDKEWRNLSVSDLISFFRHPAKYLLQKRLGIYLQETSILTEDREPFELNGLDNYKVGQELLNRYMNDQPLDSYERVLRSRDLLPAGWIGNHAYGQKAEQVREFGDNIGWVLEQKQLEDCDINLNINDFILTGTLLNIYEDSLVQYRFGKGRPKNLIELWICHLVFQLVKPTNHPGYSQLFTRDNKKPFVEYKLSPIKRAERILEELLRIYRQGLQTCCYFFPDSSFTFAEEVYSKHKKVKDGLKKASGQWKNDFSSYPNEGDDAYNKLVLGSEDPLENEQFQQMAEKVWAPFFEVLNNGDN